MHNIGTRKAGSKSEKCDKPKSEQEEFRRQTVLTGWGGEK